MLAHRTDDLFAKTAKKKGKVTTLDDEHLVIEYNDGTQDSVKIGRIFGEMSGTTIPHMVKTGLRLGQTVNIGDCICYNSNYFTPDSIYPNQVLWKAGIIAKTALLESPDTFEDSSVISQSLAEKLKTKTTKIRTIRLAFDQEVRNLVDIGDSVDVESILCTIENSTESNSEIFDEESLKTLRLLSNLTPRAKLTGVVEKIVVLYNGDIEDMSKSLKSLVERSNDDLTRLNRKLGKPAIDGSVDGSLRVDGTALEIDSVAIKVYITGVMGVGSGDKAVFSSQLKTTFARVMTGVNKTESGTPVDAIFGYRSINDRIVNSAAIIGTTNTLLRLVGELAVKAYKS